MSFSHPKPFDHDVLAPTNTRTWAVADWCLVALIVVAAFLLGCYEMADSDIWWHVGGGRWILAHRHVPDLDPFTFGSQDRHWVDIHWAFEVFMAGAYGLGGVPALVLVAASAGALAVLTAVSARRRGWPVAALLVWLPALVLVSWRFDPRPEIFTLLYTACFLAVLWRLDEHPRLAWLLPPLQVFWVNTQGLFILGPILVGFYLLDQGARWLWRRQDAEVRRSGRWRHVGFAASAVVAACLVNPYFLEGARFPFDLFPKVAAKGNIYKAYIDELASPAQLIQRSPTRLAGNWYIGTLYFLLLALPVSFVFPAAWRAWQSGGPAGRRRGRELTVSHPATGPWLAVLAGVVGLLALNTVAFSHGGEGPWVVALGEHAPAVLLIAGIAGAVSLGRRSLAAATLAAAGGMAVSAWLVWLRDGLMAAEPMPAAAPALAWPPVVFAVTAGAGSVLVLRWGGSLFRLLLAGAFAYLALQAAQNASRFALVAGVVLAWNFGEWTAQMQPRQSRSAVGWGWRVGLAAVLVAWIVALVTDRYHGWTGERRHFSLRAQPFEFAHEAIRFAGRPDQPAHALVYELGQTGLFDLYNAPAHKPFMDGRLEMPARETFQTYVAIEDLLHARDPRCITALHDLGDPLVLLTHQQNYGEAILFTHPAWRCTYYDAIAAVFVPRGRPELERVNPTVDFGKRHFAAPAAPSTPNLTGAAFRELRALSNLGTTLRDHPDANWTWRVPALLAGLDRGARALAEESRRAATWTLLGNCYWDLTPDLGERPLTPADDWDPAGGLARAQATYCYLRALDLAPNDASTLQALYRLFGLRRMADAQLAVGERLAAWPRRFPKEAAELRQLRAALAAAEAGGRPGGLEVSAAVGELLRAGRPEAAVRRAEAADPGRAVAWSWPLADRLAAAYLHLGRPGEARRTWGQATAPPSEALRKCRLASTYWMERNFDEAARLYREALADDPGCAEACWGLAVLYTQLGHAQPALRFCRQGLGLALTARQRNHLQALEPFLARYASSEAIDTR
jgi:tetratricopeptide (TPR) repeat protein